MLIFVIYFVLNLLVYTIAYGVEERKDPKEGRKVFATTMALVGVALGLFAFIRSFGTGNIVDFSYLSFNV